MSKDRRAPAALPPPGPEHGGHEVLRAAIAEGNLHVSLRHAFAAPQVWKIRLADVEAGLHEEDLVEKVRVLFEAEAERPTAIGKTNAIN
jgi:hypothetical protein